MSSGGRPAYPQAEFDDAESIRNPFSDRNMGQSLSSLPLASQSTASLGEFGGRTRYDNGSYEEEKLPLTAGETISQGGVGFYPPG